MLRTQQALQEHYTFPLASKRTDITVILTIPKLAALQNSTICCCQPDSADAKSGFLKPGQMQSDVC